jgi:hypothetical protein
MWLLIRQKTSLLLFQYRYFFLMRWLDRKISSLPLRYRASWSLRVRWSADKLASAGRQVKPDLNALTPGTFSSAYIEVWCTTFRGQIVRCYISIHTKKYRIVTGLICSIARNKQNIIKKLCSFRQTRNPYSILQNPGLQDEGTLCLQA